MSEAITISTEDLLHQVKLNYQIPSLIQRIITRKIIFAEATKVGIKVEVEELQKAAERYRLMNKLENSGDTWTWLQKHRLSLEDFEEIVYTNILSGKLAQHLFAEGIEPYFFEHQLDYAEAAIYEIVLDDRDLAMELFYAICEGEMSFPEVAHQYIQDTSLRRTGGYRGLVHRKDLKPEISAAVFAAHPPQILQPLVTSQGIHLIFVEEIVLAQLDEPRRAKIVSDLFEFWLQRKIEEAEIVIAENLISHDNGKQRAAELTFL